MDNTIISLIWLGISIGIVHAFDADHVMAMTAFVSDKLKWRKVAMYCFKWGIGHGLVLLILGSLLVVFQIQLADVWSQTAETLVGVLLIVLGISLLRRIRKQKLKLIRHSHGETTHTHLVLADEINRTGNKLPRLKHEHQPLFVGVLHGLAGSAPVLAILPAMMSQTKISGIFYLFAFSLGCLIGMSVFGVLVGHMQNKVLEISTKLFDIFRFLIAFTSISLGGYWLVN
ncbi:sulfite exporter TauE/SafE family protein [Catenovulum maritimum]|uniref:Urease accessory protein UreH-like transmembrane domain-containing protein n=1 Tax=Catenovulum maritimum TaxID=1513271 RepID=A0A0J8JH76_9ALTE|nr:sulfite exporter TauE/SafE family protein [Catenovulum maritimum]KMT63751.1 hypothetical protein XM47_17960 [Catenovulum maritimum]